ncbi:MAG: FecR domain-containing protein [Bacteroidales bacterium]
MKRNKKYWNDIAGYISGEMNPEEAGMFLEEVKQDHQMKNDYELMKKSWNDFNSNPEEKYRDTGIAWNKLHERLMIDGQLDEQPPVIRMNKVAYTIRIAAIILLILAVGVPAVYYSVTRFGTTKDIMEYSARDGILTVDLPDGSRVFLNKDANLVFKESYELQRDVTLKGEGYFDVMEDPARPFTVNTGKVVVTVLGTSFNIKESDKDNTEVFVEQGKVRMELKNGRNSVTLVPGQLGKANGDLVATVQENQNYLSWKTKDFKFVDEPVENILGVLEEAYHVEVRSEDMSVSDMRLTTSYSDQSFDAILSTICAALNMQYHKDGKVYILQPN